ncbi:hypothetical protein FZ983_32585 [Azospirillum sp. B21]|uniref:hypothetical protein n=1 Tax=Azospirillum sp. B21 TaxID=2607496 RepID=UPI0011ED9307|nr:hypothetical protein [Azospirillum sp. B21]KAA0571978.1 hypothetical protein FZ983_32585 [Azospirillum sp. B21]
MRRLFTTGLSAMALSAVALSAVAVGAGILGKRGQRQAASRAFPASPAPPAEALDRAMRDVVAYGLLPAGALAGFADWLVHRRMDIQHTAGAKESLMHIAMSGQAAMPGLALLLLETNPRSLALMVAGLLSHEATMMADLRYAITRRPVPPVEQKMHGIQNMVPAVPLAMAAASYLARHREGMEPEPALRFRRDIPPAHLAVIAAAMLLDGAAYAVELAEGLRENGGRLVPDRRERPVRAVAAQDS